MANRAVLPLFEQKPSRVARLLLHPLDRHAAKRRKFNWIQSSVLWRKALSFMLRQQSGRAARSAGTRKVLREAKTTNHARPEVLELC
jgi:hypothetical protein